jgi:hypothetical protein
VSFLLGFILGLVAGVAGYFITGVLVILANRRKKRNSAAQFFKQYEGKTLQDVLDDLDKKK